MVSFEGELVCFQAGEDRNTSHTWHRKTEKPCLLCKEPGVGVCSRIPYPAHIPGQGAGQGPAAHPNPARPRLVLYFTLILSLFSFLPLSLPPSSAGASASSLSFGFYSCTSGWHFSFIRKMGGQERAGVPCMLKQWQGPFLEQEWSCLSQKWGGEGVLRWKPSSPIPGL